jgi:hypothetical protein
MLFIQTLQNKNFFTKPDGTQVVDLTKSSLDYGDYPNINTPILVGEEYVMRPDLVAYATMGNENKFDYILKFNGVSNPFSVDKNDPLLIPVEEEMAQQFKVPESEDEKGTTNRQELILAPKTQKDKKRLEHLNKKKNKEALPPNFTKTEDENVKFKDGNIIFGDDVTSVNQENCPEPQSRARVKEKIINKKIFEE